MGWVSLALVAVAFPTFSNDGFPSISLVFPVDGSYFGVTVDAPTTDLSVQFQAGNWAYPGINKGVVFTLDRSFDPAHPTPAEGVLAIVQTGDSHPVLLAGLPAGQHTLVACLVTYQAKPGGGQWWDYLDRDPATEGSQHACTALTVNVSIHDCWPTAPDPVSGQPACDPAHPGACCVDSNSCSVETCVSMPLEGGGTEPQCRFTTTTDCCRFDVECEPPRWCHLADDPLTPLDDGLLDRCIGCDPTKPGADATCDDHDACTADTCTDGYQCAHQPYAGPLGQPCCTADVDCADADPCTLDHCEGLADGHGYCVSRSYKELSPEEIVAWGYDPVSFEGCCTPEKVAEYCTDHLIVIDNQVKENHCWNVACVSNQCLYEEITDPLCCNTATDCDDCASYDPDSGECAKPNLCTAGECVDFRCEFPWDPFFPETEDCCQGDADCDDGRQDTVEWCSNYLCSREYLGDPAYPCDLSADPPVTCPASQSACWTYDCSALLKTCLPTAVPCVCDDDAQCDDGSPCTEDHCQENACFHVDIPGCCLAEGGEDTLCDDSNPCTADWCVYGDCRHLGPHEAPPGFVVPDTCCLTDAACDDGRTNTLDFCGSDGLCANLVDPSRCDLRSDPPVLCDPGLAPCPDPVCNPYSGACTCRNDPCDDDTDCRVCVAWNDVFHCTTFDECYASTCVNHACTHAFAPTAWPACVPECYDDGWGWGPDVACDDDFPCTADACEGGHCRHFLVDNFPSHGVCCVPGDPWWNCDDHDPCTLDECVDNVCVTTPIDGCSDPELEPEPVEPLPEVVESLDADSADAEPVPEAPAEASETGNPLDVDDAKSESTVESQAETAGDVSDEALAESEVLDAPALPEADADANGPSVCPPVSPRDGACRGPLVCPYGEACCDGGCYPTVLCACTDNRWTCVYTDACLGVDVVTPYDTAPSDTAGVDEGHGGGGCASSVAPNGPLGWIALLAAVLVLLRPRRGRV